MAFSLTTAAGILTNYYVEKENAQRIIAKEHPFLDWVTKKEGIGGNGTVTTPFCYGGGEGIGTTFSDLQTIAGLTNGGQMTTGQWIQTAGELDAVIRFDNKGLEFAEKDPVGYIDGKKNEIDFQLNRFGDVLEHYMLSTKSRNIGTFTISTGVCTMTYRSDIVKIKKGMVLEASANDRTSAGHTLFAGFGYVIAVNETTGTFTVSDTADSSTPATPSGWTGTIYGFRKGDSGTTKTIVEGLGDWVPATDPTTGDAFCATNDRSVNVRALSGTRLPSAVVASLGIARRIKLLAVEMGQYGYGWPDTVWTTPSILDQLAEEQEARGIKDPIKGIGQFGLKGIEFLTPGSTVEVYACKHVPYGQIWAMQRGACILRSTKKVPSLLTGSELLVYNANQWELRMTSYPVFTCDPSRIGRTAS